MRLGIHINNENLPGMICQSSSQIDAGCSFRHPPFLVGNSNDTHKPSPVPNASALINVNGKMAKRQEMFSPFVDKVYRVFWLFLGAQRQPFKVK